MGLRTKFNIILTCICLAGLAAVSGLSVWILGVPDNYDSSSGNLSPRLETRASLGTAEMFRNAYPSDLYVFSRLDAAKTGGLATPAPTIVPVAVGTSLPSDSEIPSRPLAAVAGTDVMMIPLPWLLGSTSATVVALLFVFMVVLAVVLLVANILLSRLVLQPITEISDTLDRVSMGDFSSPDFVLKNKDEVGDLSRAVSRMRRAQDRAVRLLEQRL